TKREEFPKILKKLKLHIRGCIVDSVHLEDAQLFLRLLPHFFDGFVVKEAGFESKESDCITLITNFVENIGVKSLFIDTKYSFEYEAFLIDMADRVEKLKVVVNKSPPYSHLNQFVKVVLSKRCSHLTLGPKKHSLDDVSRLYEMLIARENDPPYTIRIAVQIGFTTLDVQIWCSKEDCE
ncbi:hypothetical protein PFISCL1PPCAC_27455, partial [Pristionchus fissidentatus]